MMNSRAIAFMLPVLVLAGAIGTVRAGDRSQSIKKRYKQASRLEKTGQNHHVVTFNTMLAAVGLQQTTVRFVFISEQADPEKDPYLLTHELVKVSVEYNIAASAQFHIEYLYDKKGALLFYFYRVESPEGLQSERIYYRAGTPFKLIRETGAADGKPARQTVTRLSEAQRKQALAAVDKARRYRSHFQEILKLEKLK